MLLFKRKQAMEAIRHRQGKDRRRIQCGNYYKKHQKHENYYKLIDEKKLRNQSTVHLKPRNEHH